MAPSHDTRRRRARRTADRKRGLSQGGGLRRLAVRAGGPRSRPARRVSSRASPSQQRRIVEDTVARRCRAGRPRGCAPLRNRRDDQPARRARRRRSRHRSSSPATACRRPTPATTTSPAGSARARSRCTSPARRRRSPARWSRTISRRASAGRRSEPPARSAASPIPNPKTVEQPWERTAPSRLNPVMTLVDPRFNDLAGMQVGATVNPASADRLFAGSGHTVAELLATGRRQEAAAAIRAAVVAARARQPRVLDATAVRQRRRAPAWQRPVARPRARRADGTPRSRRGRRAVNGDRIYNGAMDNASGIATLIEVGAHARRRQAATANGPCCSWRSPQRSTACSARATSPAHPTVPQASASSPTSTWTCSCRCFR